MGRQKLRVFRHFYFRSLCSIFTCRSMLCFSGASVKVVATCFSFYFGLKCT